MQYQLLVATNLREGKRIAISELRAEDRYYRDFGRVPAAFRWLGISCSAIVALARRFNLRTRHSDPLRSASATNGVTITAGKLRWARPPIMTAS
jgi:hypothetical protein